MAKMSVWDAMDKARNDTSVVGLDFTRAAQEAQQRGPPRVFSATLLPPLLNKIGYVKLHQSNERHGRAVDAGGKVTLSQTMRPHIVHGPAPAILALKPTSLKDIAKKVNYIHEDCILFVTTIHACHRMVGTNLLVRDDNGDCLMLTLYNFVPASADPNDYFPERTHMAILAPYMKNSGDDPSKNLFLRCDNPECIRTFDTRRSWLAAKRGKKLVDTRGLDPGELRKLGNESFTEGRWEKAARLYTRAIQCPSIEREDTIACFSNLAETRLRQELWESAEESARAVVELDPEHTKALFRLATAQIHRNKLEDARQTVANRRTKKDFQKLDQQVVRLLNEKQGH